MFRFLYRTSSDETADAIPSLNIGRVICLCMASIAFVIVLYSVALVLLTWPIDEISISKSGTFGDSFGVLNALFTGLGFAGLLITIFLQREDLRLTRSELSETRKEIKFQSVTFQQQQFEDSFYRVLALYKDNLSKLSIRKDGLSEGAVQGVDALSYLIYKFEGAWSKCNLSDFPESEDEKDEYIYTLYKVCRSIFVRQSRYVETLNALLVMIDEDCFSLERRECYWRILASQLTVYEVKYLFYQAFLMPDYKSLRVALLSSLTFRDRFFMSGISEGHRKSFENLWGVKMPRSAENYSTPLSADRFKLAHKRISKRIAIQRSLMRKTSEEVRQ
ncbi:hypothetical protein BK673_06165 [Pseudomonas fluorescens]|uniref:Phage abortive infection protein n=1 Tax=Pseudomonas fluorescens TaxID=294 RepID=A0A423P9R8_PSEFL|nr:hypothetical protein BK673_06165 [Pseudomonas fluorescens]